MILCGKVSRGLGAAKMWVGKIERAFEDKTNMIIFHGTLNIKLDEDYLVTPDFIIEPKEYGGTQKVLVKKCRILDNIAYIVRAEKNQKGQGDHNLQIVEIVSDINFREKYKLQDNEDVEIIIF